MKGQFFFCSSSMSDSEGRFKNSDGGHGILNWPAALVGGEGGKRIDVSKSRNNRRESTNGLQFV